MDESAEKQISESETQTKTKKAEVLYEVKMSGRVFGYFANRLTPIYNRELEQVRRDGSFEAIGQFHQSSIGSLMTKVLDKFEGKAEISESVLLNLSQKDIDLILDKLEPPTGFGERRIHSEMTKDLKEDFRTAKLTAEAKKIAAGMLQTLRRKN